VADSSCKYGFQSDLIRSHQLALKNKRDTGFVKEVEHVQGESKALLQQLMDLYFPAQYVAGDYSGKDLFMQNYKPPFRIHHIQRKDCCGD